MVETLSRVERGILFSGSMILEILNRRKTVTRRLIKERVTGPNPPRGLFDFYRGDKWVGAYEFGKPSNATKLCRYQPGDLLYVREGLHRPDGDPWLYRADNVPVMVAKEDETAMLVWAHHKQQDYCPSMFMPKWAARIWLEVVSVRPERLQEITYFDAQREGFRDVPGTVATAEAQFADKWIELHGPDSWGSNPWVWRIEFKHIEK